MNKIPGIKFIHSFPNGYEILEMKPIEDNLLISVKTPKDILHFYIMDDKYNVTRVIGDELTTLRTTSIISDKIIINR